MDYGSCTGYFNVVQDCYNSYAGCSFGYYRMSNPKGHDVYCTCCTDDSASNCGISGALQGYGQGYWADGNGDAVVCGDCCVDDNCNDNSNAQGKISGSCTNMCC
jgi:hypothetical protein